ncbi:MAG: sulfite exporter TauE/SafE family protein [Bacteroidia bacterium]|nr:sulfite exporter TauE/SafE family protein [Bacteroidia bacterium]
MDIALYISALTIGFLGSFHCVAMCGPIALVLPGKKDSKTAMIPGRVFYNLGRIVTYILLGLILGFIGFSISIKGFQRELSILTGVVILISVFFTSGGKHIPFLSSGIVKLTAGLKQYFKKLFGNGSSLSLFAIGLLNGLLPCGLVYLSLAGALATGSYLGGMLYMGLFGFGTFPAMFAVSIAGHYIGNGFQKYIRKASPIIAIALALLLIYRGDITNSKSCCSTDKHASINTSETRK